MTALSSGCSDVSRLPNSSAASSWHALASLMLCRLHSSLYAALPRPPRPLNVDNTLDAGVGTFSLSDPTRSRIATSSELLR